MSKSLIAFTRKPFALSGSRLVALLITGLATLTVVLPSHAADPYTYYRAPLVVQVERLIEQQQPQQALALLESKGELLNDGQYNGLSCQAFINLKNTDAAIDACHQAIKFSALNEQWVDHNNLGAAYLYDGQLEAALGSFKAALKINRTAKNARQNFRLTEKMIAAEARKVQLAQQ